MKQEKIIVYFGCWGRAGHFMHSPGRQYLSDQEIKRNGIPTAAQLDGGRLFLPYPEKVGTGAVTYLPAPNLTVLAWWGNNPWDQRGAVNQAVITSGELGKTEMWKRFVRYFPELSEKLNQPLIADLSEWIG